ncbi:MAG: glutamate racemase [Muribaculaceae bacterium]|nr:glutamate racemase [Muribaculaceae bacterium]
MKDQYNNSSAPIGVFDSGYGGLTILRDIRRRLPQYDYLYLGDNARAPYGSRSFDVVYDFTLQAVKYLFERGCKLVILACNTASAKALRTIQQCDLPQLDSTRRVLGVIRPTVEELGAESQNGNIGILGTPGTVNSGSYAMEISKLYPDYHTYSQACPMWVPLVENKEYDMPGADYFVEKYIKELFAKCGDIDTVILGCTHYPLLLEKIKQYVPSGVKILPQGAIVADSLADYLKRHSEISSHCTTNGTVEFLTTESSEKFQELASIFLNSDVTASHIVL